MVILRNVEDRGQRTGRQGTWFGRIDPVMAPGIAPNIPDVLSDFSKLVREPVLPKGTFSRKLGL